MYGFLFTGINNDTKGQRMFFFLFILRRFALIMTAFELVHHPAMQVIILLLINMFFLIFTAQTKPHKTRHDRRMDTVSEAFMMLICYHLLLFSHFGPNIDDQYTLGWSYLTTICGLLATNMFFVLKQVFHELKLKTVKRYRIWKLKRSISYKNRIDPRQVK